ncbi:hypothetical protein HJB51_29100 [Rhizobium lentis]|uniref:hypothetical protein n=1 Tax=Rhizobium lentis TaxID=1138194 RepID=UPI001C8383B8|nr:hypothetical protein [Rhizobium lentis]MBX5111991.1 hypothetical protein [Rhizobium lentis]
MADKNADLHTLAPRLSYVEDQAQWLMDNRESGGGGEDPSPKLKKLWFGLLDGAYTTGYDTPWDAQSIYESEGISMHMGLYGFDIQAAQNCLDGSGFYGHVFYPIDTRWTTTVTTNARPLVEDIFSAGSTDFVAALRDRHTSICKAIWDIDTDSIGTSRATSIIGRLEKLEQDVHDLRDDLNGLETYVDTQVARLDQRINDLS